MSITIESRSFNRTMRQLKNWSRDIMGKGFEVIAEKVTKDYKKRFIAGQDGDGRKMPEVKKSTMDMPISISGKYEDARIRREVNSSRKPLNATGASIDSIKKYKKSDGYEIGPSTQRGEDIFKINRNKRTSKKGSVIPARDMLVIGDKQLDIIEAELIKSLEKALR